MVGVLLVILASSVGALLFLILATGSINPSKLFKREAKIKPDKFAWAEYDHMTFSLLNAHNKLEDQQKIPELEVYLKAWCLAHGSWSEHYKMYHRLSGSSYRHCDKCKNLREIDSMVNDLLRKNEKLKAAGIMAGVDAEAIIDRLKVERDIASSVMQDMHER